MIILLDIFIICLEIDFECQILSPHQAGHTSSFKLHEVFISWSEFFKFPKYKNSRLIYLSAASINHKFHMFLGYKQNPLGVFLIFVFCQDNIRNLFQL